jgi:hypothetical protein
MAESALLMYVYSDCIVLVHFFRIDGEHWVHQCLTTVRIVISFKALGVHWDG